PSLLPIRRPPRAAPFPYTTLFRSGVRRTVDEELDRDVALVLRPVRSAGVDDAAFSFRDLQEPRVQFERQDTAEDIHDMGAEGERDRKSTRLNSSHVKISYAVFCLK